MTFQTEESLEALARASLDDLAAAGGVGDLVAVEDHGDGVTDVVFASALPGYVGWRWTVSVARIGDADATVLEVGLLPGDGALVAPPWVPWAERLAEYRRLHPDEPIDDGALDSDEDEDDDAEDLEDADEDGDALDDADELDGVDFENPDDPDDAESESESESELDDDDEDASAGIRAHDDASLGGLAIVDRTAPGRPASPAEQD